MEVPLSQTYASHVFEVRNMYVSEEWNMYVTDEWNMYFCNEVDGEYRSSKNLDDWEIVV